MSNRKNVNKVVLGIITGFLALSCIILISFLGYRIYTKYHGEKVIADQEKAVKERLKMIRDTQELFYRENDRYASNWNELNTFVKEGKLYSTQRKETVTLLETGVEAIKVSYDTIAGPFSVSDSLFPAQRYPDFEINSLNLIPNTNTSFILRSDTLEGISVFEVVDAEPVNPDRIEGKLDTLKIGSLIKVTTAGNWEK